MKLGIVGLPNVGKSTIFNALTKAGAQAANYPFCTIEPNVGVVTIPDERLAHLQKMHNSKKIVYTSIEFLDIAGLVKGASKGEGLGNKFLGHIREVSAIIHVVRCFKDSNITHVSGAINPLRDVGDINTELILADLESLEKRLSKVNKDLKGDKSLKKTIEILETIKDQLENGILVKNMNFSDDERTYVDSLGLITEKPVIYVANISEEMLDSWNENPLVNQLTKYAIDDGSEIVVICGRIEAEIAELEEEEKSIFLEDLGISESSLDRLIKASYRILNLISFLTTNPNESHAWTITKGTTASKAAGKVHSDFEKGFIRAETISFDTLFSCGSFSAAKEKGLVRSEGRDYVVEDGDVILFLFNV